jgi:hypothetical protein
VPLKETVRPEATVRTPLAAPTDAGKNLTEIVQLVAAVPQVVLSIRNPAPVTVGLSATAAVLVTVTTEATLLAPTATLPKLTDGRLTVRLAPVVPAVPASTLMAPAPPPPVAPIEPPPTVVPPKAATPAIPPVPLVPPMGTSG